MDKDKVLELLVGLLTEKTNNTSNSPVPFKVGEKYFIRTITYHLTGRVKEIVGKFLVMEDAAWIADSGRFNETTKNGSLDEVEPFNGKETYLNIDSVVDAFLWTFDLPNSQK